MHERNDGSSRRPWVAGMLLAGLLVVVGSGCAHFDMPVPEQFVQVSRTDNHLAALTSQEDRLLVRHRGVPHEGSLAFWTDAVRSNFVTERGYTLIEESDLKTAGGVPGHRFLFEISMNEVPYRNVLVLFVTNGWAPEWLAKRLDLARQHIYTVEFLSEKENYDTHAPALEKSLQAFEPLSGGL